MNRALAADRRGTGNHQGGPTRYAIVLVAVAVLVFAACGGSNDSDGATAPRATTPKPAPGDGRGAALVQTAEAQGESVLVDRDGFALYTFTSGGAPVPCSGACEATWPPLRPGADTPLSSNDSIPGLSIVSDDERTQVALRELPLYRYVGDTEPGEVNGDGILSFGGTWRVATPPNNGDTQGP